MTTRFITTLCAMVLSVSLYGQAIRVEDPDNMDPTKEIKIIVDLTQTSNEWGIVEAAAGGEDMYIWTWKPFEFPASSTKANGIGPVTLILAKATGPVRATCSEQASIPLPFRGGPTVFASIG